MAVETNPGFLQAGSYAAELLRRSITYLLARGATVGSVTGGLVAATDCQVTAGSGMQILTAPGEVVVPQNYSATGGGVYCRVSSSNASAVAASDPSNPRIDMVAAQVKDAAYSGAENSFSIVYLTGEPKAGATLGNLTGAPALPKSAVALAYVLVPSKASSIVAEDVKNVAPLLNLGLIPGLLSVGTAQLVALAVTTAKLGEGAVTEAKIAAEAVTDAKVVKGRALVETVNAYSKASHNKAEMEAGVEMDATRMALVNVEPAAETNIYVKGVLCGLGKLASQPVLAVVSPGEKITAQAECTLYKRLV